MIAIVILALLTAMLTQDTDVQSLLHQVDKNRLRATVEHLASMQTRNTSSAGLKEACDWIAGEFRAIPGLQVEVWSYPVVASRRVPKDTTAYEVIATLPGKTDRTVLVGGHIDSINMTNGADPLTARAPGANDDLSGVALTLELARLMSRDKWNQTLKFVAFSGEEQGLLGSAALAKRAKDEKWALEAVFSNDMVGNSSNKAGQKDDKRVRCFSEEGETHESRELARFTEWVVRSGVKGHSVKLVFRKDRFGRGGDHSSFVANGFTAVRLVEVYEEYSRQHTPDDLPGAMDFDYLANNTRVNLCAMASVANAALPPTEVKVVRDQSHDTSLTWKSQPGVKYAVYWRETTSPVWESMKVVGDVDKVKIPLVDKDDHVFAVGAVGGIPREAK